MGRVVEQQHRKPDPLVKNDNLRFLPIPGPDRPADRVHPRYNILIRTGRTSSRYPNIQNVPKAEGIRYQDQASAGHVLETVSLTGFQTSNLTKQRFIAVKKANPLEMMGNS